MKAFGINVAAGNMVPSSEIEFAHLRRLSFAWKLPKMIYIPVK